MSEEKDKKTDFDEKKLITKYKDKLYADENTIKVWPIKDQLKYILKLENFKIKESKIIKKIDSKLKRKSILQAKRTLKAYKGNGIKSGTDEKELALRYVFDSNPRSVQPTGICNLAKVNANDVILNFVFNPFNLLNNNQIEASSVVTTGVSC